MEVAVDDAQMAAWCWGLVGARRRRSNIKGMRSTPVCTP
jgi:hypothetical protein